MALTEGAMIIGKCCSEFLMSFEDEAEDAPRDGFLMGPPLTLRFHPSEIGTDRVDRSDEKHNKDGNGQT